MMAKAEHPAGEGAPHPISRALAPERALALNGSHQQKPLPQTTQPSSGVPNNLSWLGSAGVAAISAL